MNIATLETYRSFVQFRKSKKRFEGIGFECISVDVTKTWAGMKIVAEYRKENGSIEDVARI